MTLLDDTDLQSHSCLMSSNTMILYHRGNVCSQMLYLLLLSFLQEILSVLVYKLIARKFSPQRLNPVSLNNSQVLISKFMNNKTNIFDKKLVFN